MFLCVLIVIVVGFGWICSRMGCLVVINSFILWYLRRNTAIMVEVFCCGMVLVCVSEFAF